VEGNAYIGGVIVCLGYLVVGIRLYRRSLQTRDAPERLISAALLLWGLAYVCWQLPLAISDESLFRPLYITGRFLTDAGTVAQLLFIRLVFRPDSRFATALVAGVSAGLVLGIAGSGWMGDWEAIYPLRNPWWWLEWASITVSVAWIGVEGFHNYRRAKLRSQFGLCDAMTGNRFLLWGLTGAFWMAYELAYPIQQIEFDATGSFSASMDAIVSFVEMIPVVCIWLIFFPPTSYQRWITRGASVANPEKSKIPADLR
jgi:hypothetical protein